MILVLGVWTFLRALIRDIAAADFFVVPTLTFRLLFGFLILRHNRRGSAQVPKYLLRDRDAIYGSAFVRRVKGLGMSEILIAPRAPWQNPFAERVIGSIRRESRKDGGVRTALQSQAVGLPGRSTRVLRRAIP